MTTTMMPADPRARSDLPTAARDWPAYWLVCLERAITDGNYPEAAQAQQELRRLGLDVTVRLLPRPKAA